MLCAGIRYPYSASGARFGNYIDWMVQTETPLKRSALLPPIWQCLKQRRMRCVGQVLSWSVTLMQCPAMSIPVGFSTDGVCVCVCVCVCTFPGPTPLISRLRSSGLPIGVQIIAPPFCETVLLAAAAAYEAAHPAASSATPVPPARRQCQFQADIDGPRTGRCLFPFLSLSVSLSPPLSLCRPLSVALFVSLANAHTRAHTHAATEAQQHAEGAGATLGGLFAPLAESGELYSRSEPQCPSAL